MKQGTATNSSLARIRFGQAQRTAQSAMAAVRGFRYARKLPKAVPEESPERVPSPLEEYFDEITEGPGIWKWRHYFDIYHRHLGKFVGREVHLVEVGIYSGGSLPMWRRYLGEGARIYGVDIEPACRVYEQDGVRVFIGDQADPTFWESFREQVPTVDVVIDDGSHLPQHQIATVEALLPHIRHGGVYLCEDVHGMLNPFQAYVDALARPLHKMSSVAGVHQHIASVHTYPQLVVIEKPERPIERFESPMHGTEWQPFLDDAVDGQRRAGFVLT